MSRINLLVFVASAIACNCSQVHAEDASSAFMIGADISWVQQFEEGYKPVREQKVAWTAAPDKYRRHVEAGFGIWMYGRWRQVGWNLDDFSRNHFTPQQFETAVRAALGCTAARTVRARRQGLRR